MLVFHQTTLYIIRSLGINVRSQSYRVFMFHYSFVYEQRFFFIVYTIFDDNFMLTLSFTDFCTVHTEECDLNK